MKGGEGGVGGWGISEKTEWENLGGGSTPGIRKFMLVGAGRNPAVWGRIRSRHRTVRETSKMTGGA